MKKWLKRILWTLFGLVLLFAIAFGAFIYKVKYGFPIYEKTPPELSLNADDFTVLVFSKTNGFPHSGAISEAKQAFQSLGEANGWSVVISDNGAVFNDDQLPLFDVVIWSNATGRNLTDTQRASFKNYMESGGSFIGIHGAGDASHHWPWYEQTLIGANFTHHTMNPQFQEATMTRECSNSFTGCAALPEPWVREEEWYVFTNNPREGGANVIYTVDENTFDPNGNIKFMASDKNFGMGDDHPIVWYRCLSNGGKAFYSALGHSGEYFKETNHLLLLESAIEWAGDKNIVCQ